MSKQKWRNAPVFLTTVANIDLTEFPVKITIQTPTTLFKSLNVKEIKTDKVHVIFEDLGGETYG
jgi:hypothetical protein